MATHGHLFPGHGLSLLIWSLLFYSNISKIRSLLVVAGGMKINFFTKGGSQKKKQNHQNADHQKAESFSNPTHEQELPRGYFKAMFCLEKYTKFLRDKNGSTLRI